MKEPEKKRKKMDGTGMFLYFAYLVTMLLAIPVAIKIVRIQTTFEPKPEVYRRLTPNGRYRTETGKRGYILDCKGRILSLTCPEFQIGMDCTIGSDKVWKDSLKYLCSSLHTVFKDIPAEKFDTLLSRGRRAGSHYVRLGKPVDYFTMCKIKTFPIFCRGKYKGGIAVDQLNTRRRPYGELAKCTIGYIRPPQKGIANNRVGLEDSFNDVLEGRIGKIWLRETDFGSVRNYDSTYVEPIDGKDIRTTLDIDYQRFAEKALRETIENVDDIEGGCLVLMDVKTGAVKVMVNLSRPKKGKNMTELTNLAVERTGEPGSVFKTTNLMMMLEDGHVKSLGQTVPTNNGLIKGYDLAQDEHIVKYERAHGNAIPIIAGYKVSANYVFQYLAVRHYSSKPEEYVANLRKYGMDEALDFDVKGKAMPYVTGTDNRLWSKSTLTSLAIGYAAKVTPLQILTFYNAIAGKGRMVKPYLVSNSEVNGKVMDNYQPVVLNENICSERTADTLTRAMCAVTSKGGTAEVLSNAKYKVAGKTGTAWIYQDKCRSYFDSEGRCMTQGTFVGFFPVDKPQYSIICVTYSYLSHTSYYGGGLAARTAGKVIDWIHDERKESNHIGKGKSGIPSMSREISAEQDAGERVSVPDTKGMGLKDALYVLENSGLKCRYTGTGHVCGQEPVSGSRVERGAVIKIELK